jgi:hypothetical protein
VCVGFTCVGFTCFGMSLFGSTCFDMSFMRHVLAGAAVVVSGRPLGSSVTAQRGGDNEEELEGGRRVMRKCRKREREVGRAKGGASQGPLSQRCVQVWLAMVGALRISAAAQVRVYCFTSIA